LLKELDLTGEVLHLIHTSELEVLTELGEVLDRLLILFSLATEFV
jgi:hypothetical protein